MPQDEKDPELLDTQTVTWSSKQIVRENTERRLEFDRRRVTGRAITVPDMRSDYDRRTGEDRRKVRLIITGRAIDV